MAIESYLKVNWIELRGNIYRFSKRGEFPEMQEFI
jgi:hypothetical protein